MQVQNDVSGDRQYAGSTVGLNAAIISKPLSL